jgi:hypothetical protein
MTMPRTTQEIIDSADELARRFEDYDPRPADERPASAVRKLREAAIRRAESERDVVAAVREARNDGLSWAKIGEMLGTTGEAARQRYKIDA